MNKLILILSFTLLISCRQQQTKTNSKTTKKVESVTKGKTHQKITFSKVNRKAFLLGENIKLLDENFKEIKDISFLNEQYIKVTEVSDKYHKVNPTDDYCQEFKYVKIKTNGLEGYVDGRKLYEPIKNAQNKIVKIDNNEVSFIPSTHFGIGVSDDDGLTGCSINTPVIFSDKNAKYEGFVKMIKNKNYKNDYIYFELKDDDGANDEILNINKEDDKYLLKIKRTYQEGGANLLISIYKDKSGAFVAEILENIQIEQSDN